MKILIFYEKYLLYTHLNGESTSFAGRQVDAEDLPLAPSNSEFATLLSPSVSVVG